MKLKVCCVLLGIVALPFAFEATTGCSFHPGRAPDITPVAPNSYVCSCTCEPGQHHREVRVSAAFDDAEQGTVDAVDLDLGQSIVGVRFAGVEVPAGAAILSATVQFTADSAFGGDNTGPIDLDIYAIAANDVPSFGGNFVNLGTVTRTAASAGWPIPPWTLNESGPAEQTTDLKDIIQEIVDLPGWQPGNALALIFAGIGRREAVAFDGNPARAAVLSVDFLDPVDPAVFDLYTCVPPFYDGNLAGGSVPTAEQLQDDCANRVQPTLSGMAEKCGYPSDCSCNLVDDTLKYAGPKCDAECMPTEVDAQCTNFDPENGHVEANAVVGAYPVCTEFSPLSADVFGQRTLCSVHGKATITATSGDDTDSESSDATGIVQFVGAPCPGQSCTAGIEYSLDFANVKVGNFFESATFNKLAGSGESFSGGEAVISSIGDGTFAPQSLGAAAQGRRDNGVLKGLVSSNDDAVSIHIGWGESVPMCAVHGTLVGSVDPELKRCDGGPDAGMVCQSESDCTQDPSCTDGVCSCAAVDTGNLAMSLDVDGGMILNQPPTANAGPNQTVECNAAAVTNAVLDGSGSSDLDGNISIYSWFRGSRVGPEVGSSSIAHVQQPIGTETYILRVIDTFGQADEDTTEVEVADTTPPVLSCSVAVSTLGGTNHDLVNVGLEAGAVDQCEGELPVTVNVFSDEDDEGTGDGNFSPDAKDIDVGSLRLRAERSGKGDGRVYLIIPEATDSSGNRGFSCCTVTVPRSNAPADLTWLETQADVAQAHCLINDGTPPDGYFTVGDGPVIGPKQ